MHFKEGAVHGASGTVACEGATGGHWEPMSCPATWAVVQSGNGLDDPFSHT